MLESSKPVVAVTAVRTGVGKSPTSRKVCALLREAGRSPIVIRHPMPYGDLAAQRVQLFRTRDDLVAADVTIEEREEYEHHLDAGTPVMAGVDYEAILRVAEDLGDVIVFDGGNNDLPLVRPDVHIVLVDPHRAGHETTYHPGEANLRMADAVIITKVDTADPYAIAEVEASVHRANPKATVVTAALTTSLDTDRSIAGMRVLVIEDGPTLTHGSMKYGAGVLAAQAAEAIVVDPRDAAVGSIRDTFEHYDVGPLLPALGYSAGQLAELSKTIAAVDCDLVLVATPVDLTKLISIDKPTVRVGYDYEDVGSPTLHDILAPVL
jgi:predicted GTPase